MKSLSTDLLDLQEKLDEVNALIPSIVKRVHDLLAIAGGDEALSDPALAPLREPSSTPLPFDPPPVTTEAMTVPAPAPVVVTPPTVVARPAVVGAVIEKVHSTCWGNKADEESGEWSQFAYSWAPACTPGSGKTTLGVALPAKVAKGTTVSVRLSGGNGQWFEFPVIDKGPWNTNDPYWRTGARPQAESGTDKTGRKTNKAGIDLTPFAWSVLLGWSADKCWTDCPDGYVDIVVHEDGVVSVSATTDLGARIVDAAKRLPVPFPYQPETEGGVLGCANVVSRILVDAGVIPSLILNVDGVTAKLKSLGWKKVEAPYRDGDVIAWSPWDGSNGHKHVGIIDEDGGVIWVVDNSSSKRAVVREKLSDSTRPIEQVLRHP